MNAIEIRILVDWLIKSTIKLKTTIIVVREQTRMIWIETGGGEDNNLAHKTTVVNDNNGGTSRHQTNGGKGVFPVDSTSQIHARLRFHPQRNRIPTDTTTVST